MLSYASGVVFFLSSFSRDVNMMAKMALIKRKLDAHPAYAASPICRICSFLLTQINISDIELEGVGNDRKLVFRPSPQGRYEILKLLDDDFLKSVADSA